MQWDNTFLGKARNTDDGQISSIHNVQDDSRPFVCNSCIFRTPVQPGGDVYLPACFPPESLQDNAKPAPLVLSDEDMGEVSLQIPLFNPRASLHCSSVTFSSCVRNFLVFYQLSRV